MAGSFLGEVLRRHPSDQGLWPGEKLLTDVTAAVLNEIGGLAAGVASFLSDGVQMEGDVEAASEIPLEERRRMDLALRDEGDRVVWVEIKDTAPESGDQLPTYDRLREQAQAEGREAWLVYLVPLASAPASIPRVKTWRWQELAGFMERWAAGHADQLAPHEQWLLSDYLTYLHERGLAMTQALPQNMVSIVEKYWTLWQQLDTLHTLLKARVTALAWIPIEGRFWHQNGGKIDVWPANWWSVYQADPAEAYATCDFDFSLSGLTPDSDRQPTFRTGLVWREDRGPSPMSDSAWLSHLLQLQLPDGLGAFAVATDGYHVHRTIRISELSASSLNEQAEEMLRLVKGSFEALQDNPPSSVAR